MFPAEYKRNINSFSSMENSKGAIHFYYLEVINELSTC